MPRGLTRNGMVNGCTLRHMPRSRSDDRWIRECKGCGRQFWQQRANLLYCSRECADDHRSDWAHPKGGPRAAGGLALRICTVCGTEYEPVRVSQLACSRTCRARLPSQRAYDKSPERRARQNALRSKASPERKRRTAEQYRTWRLAKYGLTIEDFDRMLAAQGGVCIICGQPPKLDGIRAASRLHPDHDHVTGRTRDLLCLSCNVGVGHFRDDPVLLRAAAEYIERHRAAVRSSE